MSKILLVTDAWKPQVNGVVTTLVNLVDQAKKQGDTIYVYHPGRCKIRFPLPLYKEITIGIPFPCGVRKLLKSQKWEHIHIATPEAPIGLNFVRTCKRLNIPFSTSLHTLFPEFVEKRIPIIKSNIGWKYMHKVYEGSSTILTTTKSVVNMLKEKGFTQEIKAWSRGVDRNIFKPSKKYKKTSKNILLCVSRVSHEKGLDDFCSLEYPDSIKILVGDGPYLKTLKKKYPDVYDVVETISQKQASRQVESLQEEVKSLRKREEDLVVQSAYRELVNAHQDFNELKDSQEFIDWLNTQPASISDGVTKNNKDSKWAIRVVDLYKADNGVSKSKPSSTTSAAQSVTKTKAKSVNVSGDTNKKIWKQSEIQKMSSRTYEKFENEIDIAFKEGRVDTRA